MIFITFTLILHDRKTLILLYSTPLILRPYNREILLSKSAFPRWKGTKMSASKRSNLVPVFILLQIPIAQIRILAQALGVWITTEIISILRITISRTGWTIVVLNKSRGFGNIVTVIYIFWQSWNFCTMLFFVFFWMFGKWTDPRRATGIFTFLRRIRTFQLPWLGGYAERSNLVF